MNSAVSVEPYGRGFVLARLRDGVREYSGVDGVWRTPVNIAGKKAFVTRDAAEYAIRAAVRS